VVLWESTGSASGPGTIGQEVAANNTVYQDGENIKIIQDVLFTPSDSDSSTGTVKLIFDPNYRIDVQSKFTLSFNVKTTETAAEEYVENLRAGDWTGYAGVSGDESTDYADNSTSSEKPGFHANESASVKYRYKDNSTVAYVDQTYDHPVVQVESFVDLSVEKEWVEGSRNHPDSITFQLLDAGGNVVELEGSDSFTLNEENNWSKSFVNIPSNYTVQENVPDGYEVSYDKRISEDDDVTIIITNREEPVPGTISVSKKWYQQDGTLLEGAPEDEVQVQLMRKGTVEDSGSGSGEEHTVTFQINARGRLGDNWWALFYQTFDTQTVLDGGSIEFAFAAPSDASGVWRLGLLAKVTESSSTNSPIDTGNTYYFGNQTEDGLAINAPIYRLSDVKENTVIKMDVYDVWGAHVNWLNFANAPYMRKHYVITNPEAPDPTPGEDETIQYGDPLTLSEANNWQGKWENLPAEDDNGNAYSYFIEEVTIGGEPAQFTDYEIDYVNNDGIEYGHITVKNTAPVNYGYELPETGGRGISAYLIGGIFLLGLIPFYKYIDHKKRKRYES
ncbi:MAG: Cna B-type domain-containing protein, partial [Clostridiaceae bacterium]|nr:Cna B-type domain-containing protein [Clostridiaceae bacterium]